MTAKRKCSGKIWGDYRDVSGRAYQCTRDATVERNGQWFCWQHDPERMKADKGKRRAAENAKADRRAAIWRRRARNARLAELVTPEMVDLLEWLITKTTQVILETACAYGSDHPLVMQQNEQVETARALTSRIREALEETSNEAL